jgi:hypothetical protein
MAMAKGSFAGRMARSVAKKAVTRLMDRVGGKLVQRIADTSSDAPDSRFKPKRDLYSTMVSESGKEPNSESE